MKSGSLVVKHHSPWGSRFLQIVLILIAVLCGVGVYYFGQYRGGYNHLHAREELAKLESVVDELQADKAELRDRIALIEQSTQVDEKAYVQVKENLRALQQENLELREEVSFYRGIVAPGESSAGIRVDRFKIDKVDDKGLFHYKFVLTQVLKNNQPIKGSVKINIDGILKGLPKVLSLAEVSVEKQKQLEFNFKYFQRFEGDFLLPNGFAPRQVQLEVNPYKRKEIKTNIDWPGVTAKKSAEDALDTGSDS